MTHIVHKKTTSFSILMTGKSTAKGCMFGTGMPILEWIMSLKLPLVASPINEFIFRQRTAVELCREHLFGLVFDCLEYSTANGVRRRTHDVTDLLG